MLLRPWTRPRPARRRARTGRGGHRHRAGPVRPAGRCPRRSRRRRGPRRDPRTGRPAPRPGPARTRRARRPAARRSPRRAPRRSPVAGRPRRERHRPPRRSTASRCSGTGGRASAASTSRRDGGAPAPPVSSSAARRITMPGVQKPHWLAPWATKAQAQRSRSAVGSPSEGGHTSSGDAADGSHARHPGQAVDPHRAAPALSLWAAAVLEGATAELLTQHVEKRDPVGDDDRVAVQREGDGWAARVGRHRAGGVVGCGAGAAQGVGRASGPGLS